MTKKKKERKKASCDEHGNMYINRKASTNEISLRKNYC